MNIRIDNEAYDVRHTHGTTVRDGRTEFVLFASREEAGEEARAHYADMAENDPTEFRCLVGDGTLIAWAMGRYAGPGSVAVKSLDAWLDLWADSPEEHFASYDSDERTVSGPTAAEQERAAFIRQLGAALDNGDYREDGSDSPCMGIDANGSTYWLMEVGHKGVHGTRFSDVPAGDAIVAVKNDLYAALENDEIVLFVEAWEDLVDELGFTPAVAYRSN